VLIRNAELDCGARVADVRISDGRISEIGTALRAARGDAVIDAHGDALLPGLHDHHLHLFALAAAHASVQCGPPEMQSAAALAQRLREAAARLHDGAWLRGVGYHESVAGEIDRDWLDRWVPMRPLRVQHRSGRLWILNSRALEQLGELAADVPLERVDGRISGRLYDSDAWLRSRIGATRPDLSEVSRLYASYGVTGLTDTSHHNGPEEFRIFAMARQRGELRQDVLVMGDTRLDRVKDGAGVYRGAHKFHLHEHELPEFDLLCAQIRRAHRAGRAVAFHCVTRTDLVLALGALREAGSKPGDRIEHAAVTPPELMPEFVALGLAVVTQPGFIAERGDDYLRDVATEDQPWLYRLRGFLDAGVALAGSSDAPYTDPNPWLAMQAAVTRRTRDGRSIGADEALMPEQALALFTSPLRQPGALTQRVAVGAPADLCLLDAPWRHVRANLAKTRVRMTLKDGAEIWGGDAER
jgi:predicted amidohydrolase YtcJ